jgi:hypothetical protein
MDVMMAHCILRNRIMIVEVSSCYLWFLGGKETVLKPVKYLDVCWAENRLFYIESKIAGECCKCIVVAPWTPSVFFQGRGGGVGHKFCL